LYTLDYALFSFPRLKINSEACISLIPCFIFFRRARLGSELEALGLDYYVWYPIAAFPNGKQTTSKVGPGN